MLEHAPLLGATHSKHALGTWIYLASFHASRVTEPLAFRVDLADLGADRPSGPLLSYDWRSGQMERVAADAGFDLSLRALDWDYRVLCPIACVGDVEIAIVGDAARYATAGDKRIASVRASESGVTIDLLGAANERLRITGWATRAPVRAVAHDPGGAQPIEVVWDAASGRFDLEHTLPSCGWTQLRIATA